MQSVARAIQPDSDGDCHPSERVSDAAAHFPAGAYFGWDVTYKAGLKIRSWLPKRIKSLSLEHKVAPYSKASAAR